LRKIKILDNKAELRGLVRRIGVRDTSSRGSWKIFLLMRNMYGSREAVSIGSWRGVLILVFSQLCKW
jgi:hypothetical protein